MRKRRSLASTVPSLAISSRRNAASPDTCMRIMRMSSSQMRPSLAEKRRREARSEMSGYAPAISRALLAVRSFSRSPIRSGP